MSQSVGVFNVPLVEFGGQDAFRGEFNVPMVSFGGATGGSHGVFDVPLARFKGKSENRATHGRFDVPLARFYGQSKSVVISGGRFVVPLVSFSGKFTEVIQGRFNVPLVSFTTFGLNTSRGNFDVPLAIVSGHIQPYVVRPIYKGVAMNIINQAISQYRNFNFNSIAYFDGHYYGANEDGLFLLEGEKDGETYIQSKLKTGPLDFGDRLIKYLRDVWLTYRSDGQLAIVFATREDEGDRTEEFPLGIVSQNIHEERCPAPRGLRGRHYIVELKNLSGSDFDIDEIGFIVDSIRKRIR